MQRRNFRSQRRLEYNKISLDLIKTSRTERQWIDITTGIRQGDNKRNKEGDKEIQIVCYSGDAVIAEDENYFEII